MAQMVVRTGTESAHCHDNKRKNMKNMTIKKRFDNIIRQDLTIYVRQYMTVYDRFIIFDKSWENRHYRFLP